MKCPFCKNESTQGTFFVATLKYRGDVLFDITLCLPCERKFEKSLKEFCIEWKNDHLRRLPCITVVSSKKK